MKRLLLSAIAICAFTATTLAQGFIISGKILDENNKPLKDAGIQAIGKDVLGSCKSNTDGLYYTNEIPDGTYEVVIFVNKTPYTTALTIAKTDPKKRFYNFKLQGKKAILTTTDKDVFMETALAKVKNSPRVDIREGSIMLKEDGGKKK